MKKVYAIVLLSLLIILAGCTSKYDVKLSEVQFDHDQNSDADIIRYTALNPTNYNLLCQLVLEIPQQEPVYTEFTIGANQTLNYTLKAKFPEGETKVIMQTRCKPSTQ